MIRLFLLLTAVLLGWPSSPLLGQSQVETGLQPGDAIKLTVWREPDMSGDILVQEDGVAVFPRLGPVVVVGREIETLKRDLIAEYSKTLRNPSIQIIVLRRVTISGEVRAPGIFKVDPSTSLTEALALAGGPTPNADRKKIRLLRGGQEITIDLNKALTVGDLSIQSGDQIHVPERNWLARNWPLALSATSTVVSMVILLSR